MAHYCSNWKRNGFVFRLHFNCYFENILSLLKRIATHKAHIDNFIFTYQKNAKIYTKYYIIDDVIKICA